MKAFNGLSAWILYGTMIYLSACAKSSNGGGGNNTPLVTAGISGTAVSRQKANSNARFYVDLNAVPGSDVSVAYATQDGTAKAGTDFVAASGTLTIPAGQQEGYIDVTIIGDSLRQSQQAFTVVLSSPVKCTL
ncbi:MAG: Calx-beta domain-containing protein, partial [Chitinophaga rupis]